MKAIIRHWPESQPNAINRGVKSRPRHTKKPTVFVFSELETAKSTVSIPNLDKSIQQRYDQGTVCVLQVPYKPQVKVKSQNDTVSQVICEPCGMSIRLLSN